jgi:hypothetical protein
MQGEAEKQNGMQFPEPRLTCRSFQFPFLRLVGPGNHLEADGMPKRGETLTDIWNRLEMKLRNDDLRTGANCLTNCQLPDITLSVELIFLPDQTSGAEVGINRPASGTQVTECPSHALSSLR